MQQLNTMMMMTINAFQCCNTLDAAPLKKLDCSYSGNLKLRNLTMQLLYTLEMLLLLWG